jgi:Flp pilus assembly protein TadD
MSLIVDLEKLAEMRAALPPDTNLDPEAWLERANAAMSTDDAAAAAQLVQSALIVSPEHQRSWALAGAIADRLGDIAAARDAYRRALELEDTDDVTTLALAQLHASVGEWREAEGLASWLARNGEDDELSRRAADLAQQVRERRGAQQKA